MSKRISDYKIKLETPSIDNILQSVAGHFFHTLKT